MALLHLPAARAAAEQALGAVFGRPVVLAAARQPRMPTAAAARLARWALAGREQVRRGARGLRDWLTEEVPDPDPARSLATLGRGPRWPWVLLAGTWLVLAGLACLGLAALLPPPAVPWGTLVTAARPPARAAAHAPTTHTAARYLYYWTHNADFTPAQCALLPAALRPTCRSAVAVQLRHPPARTLREKLEGPHQRLAFLYEYRHGTHFNRLQCALLPTAYVIDCVTGTPARAPPS